MKTCVGVIAFSLAAASTSAQTQPSAVNTPADVVGFLMTNRAVVTCAREPGGVCPADRDAAEAARDTVTRALLVSLATVPIATSSSGFVYRLDPELGTMTRVSDSFGTFFVERAMTSGRGRTSFGVSGTTAAYDRLDGFNLRDGTLITTANQFRDEGAPFDTEALTLKLRTSTMTIFGSYGVTDRFEIGGAVPLVQLHLEGSRLEVYRGELRPQAGAVADASGIADVAVRGKYTVVSTPHGGAAAAAELRLPTGDETSLLGTGHPALRLLAIGSLEQPHVGVHGYVGIVQGGASDEYSAGGALTLAVTPRVTATGEFLFRRLSSLHTIGAASKVHPTFVGRDPLTGDPVPVDTMRLLPGDKTTSLSTMVTGFKWNAKASMVLTGQIQWRIGDGGLTAPFTPTLSFDYLF